jgi:hypothetical protein
VDRPKEDQDAACRPERVELRAGGTSDRIFTGSRLGTLTSWWPFAPPGLDVSWVERRPASTPASNPPGMPQGTTTKSDPVWVAMLALIGSSLVSLGVFVRRRLFDAESENEPV